VLSKDDSTKEGEGPCQLWLAMSHMEEHDAIEIQYITKMNSR